MSVLVKNRTRLKINAMITEDKVIEIYALANYFCKVFLTNNSKKIQFHEIMKLKLRVIIIVIPTREKFAKTFAPNAVVWTEIMPMPASLGRLHLTRNILFMAINYSSLWLCRLCSDFQNTKDLLHYAFFAEWYIIFTYPHESLCFLCYFGFQPISLRAVISLADVFCILPFVRYVTITIA